MHRSSITEPQARDSPRLSPLEASLPHSLLVPGRFEALLVNICFLLKFSSDGNPIIHPPQKILLPSPSGSFSYGSPGTSLLQVTPPSANVKNSLFLYVCNNFISSNYHTSCISEDISKDRAFCSFPSAQTHWYLGWLGLGSAWSQLLPRGGVSQEL